LVERIALTRAAEVESASDMRYRLAVFASLWAIILGLEYLFEVPVAYDPFVERFFVAVLIAGGLTFFWFQFRRRSN
jgi:hypothetical protein